MHFKNDFDSYSLESLEKLAYCKNQKIEVMKMISDPRFFILPKGMREREHSILIDKILGFKVLKTEQKLLKKYKPFYQPIDIGDKEFFIGSEAWIGLHPQILLTPYSEIYEMIKGVLGFDIKSITDFGCAYGRIGIVASSFFPKSVFTGYEIVSQRVKEARRVYEKMDLGQHSITEVNILDEDFVMPISSMYFIYDFSHVEHIKKILSKLQSFIGVHDFILIARGEEVRSLIQLYYPLFYTRHKPLHRKGCSTYFTHAEVM